jgi:hypothetical protein
MAGLLATLMRPDRQDDPDRGVLIQAANILQVGEFQFVQLAYSEWFGHDMPAHEIDGHFRDILVRGRTPGWATRHAQRIIDWDARGLLAANNPDYHRFDNMHYSQIPGGTRRFAVAVACLALALGGGLALSHFAAHKGSSILPPYFDERNLPQVQARDDVRGS